MSRLKKRSEAVGYSIDEGTLSVVIGRGTLCTGNPEFKTMLRVDGRILGERVTSLSGTLVVGAEGQVDAKIEVAVAKIYGIVNGDIIATRRIEMRGGSKVRGNIQCPSLVLEPIVDFEGNWKVVDFEGTCKIAHPSDATTESIAIKNLGQADVMADVLANCTVEFDEEDAAQAQWTEKDRGDFAEWCEYVLFRADEVSTFSEALFQRYLTVDLLAEVLFGRNFLSAERSRLNKGIEELVSNGLVTKKQEGQMCTIGVCFRGLKLREHLRMLKSEVFAVKLSIEAEGLLQIVNRFSQKGDGSIEWVGNLRRDWLPLGWGDSEKRSRARRELEDYGFVRSYPPKGSDFDLIATYRGILWETRRVRESNPEAEYAHVLFIDIVGYSKLSLESQAQTLQHLQDSVQSTHEFCRSQARGQLINLPTGDGFALVFFGRVTSHVQCAVELSRTLKKNSSLKLRMGVHSGLVYRVADINEHNNVVGPGINKAQRVMDCGDAGHILISKEVADVLIQMGKWEKLIHDLGEAEVKHGEKIQVLNLCDKQIGNSDLPIRFRARSNLPVSPG